MLKITPIIRNTAIASAFALTALGTASCSKSETKTNDSFQNTGISNQEQGRKTMDFSKPNLPMVEINALTGNQVIYRNVDGDLVKITRCSDEKLSLYNAINKYSTVEKPDIEDVEGFYCKVEKNNIQSSGSGIMYFDSSVRKTMLLKNLYDIFTAPDSEKGKTITVKEYTHMMDAWSSTN